MVAISKLITGAVLFGASALATPLERRQNPACLLDPAVTNAVICITGCLTGIADPTKLANLPSCVSNCVTGLATAEITCIRGILGSVPGLPGLPLP